MEWIPQNTIAVKCKIVYRTFYTEYHCSKTQNCGSQIIVASNILLNNKKYSSSKFFLPKT